MAQSPCRSFCVRDAFYSSFQNVKGLLVLLTQCRSYKLGLEAVLYNLGGR